MAASSASSSATTAAPPPATLDVRSLALQALALVAVVLGSLVGAQRGGQPRRAQYRFGLRLLKDTAGFAISEGLLPYEAGDSYGVPSPPAWPTRCARRCPR
jgi:general L-amino acid transport system permease protein